MTSDFEKLAIQRLLDKADALGVAVPREIAELACADRGNIGAMLWARANPDDQGTGCCWGDVQKGPSGCTCWMPVFDVEQATPVMPTSMAGFPVQDRMCGDCAYRKDSPERADAYTEEALLAMPAGGPVFYCHEGMRRPVRWEHPDGRTVPGSPDDWQPLTVRGIPFRADGRPGLTCAGWAARNNRATNQNRRDHG